jgi:DNA-binding SARP family transcriptional activator
VRVLGPLGVDGVDPAGLGSRKARTFLAALAAAGGQPVATDELVELLWEGRPPARPADQVSVLASRLRRALGTERIVRSGAGYALHADWIDVVELEERVAEAEARMAAGSPTAARAAASAAAELVRGRLAAEENALWFDDRRLVVERVVARARSLLADAALAAGDPATAVAAASLVLDADPYDEVALRTLMRGHVALGRSAAALAVYAAVRERLVEDLGADPSAATEALHTAILMGEALSSVAPPLPTIVGRDVELARLDTLLDRARGGAAVGIDVVGELGIGKTALLEAFVSRVADRALVVVGRCDVLGRELPLQPLLDGLEGQLRMLGPDAVAAALGSDAELLGPLVGVTGPDDAAVTTVHDLDEAQAVLFNALLRVIERVAGGRVAVVVVEDVHFAGTSTIAWLAHALRRGRHLLVAVSRRPQEGPALVGAEELTLGPLDLDAAVALVGDRAHALYERVEGNPLFLLELAASGDDDMPVSIRELVAARADALGDEVASTLRAAALLGTTVDLDLLASVLGRPLDDLLDHLEAGTSARILTEAAGGLRFAHELVREALAGATTAARRAYYHREAARALVARVNADPLDVAWHARRGGDDVLAASALTVAGVAAFRRHDAVRSQELFDESIAVTDSASARIERARLHMAAWRHTAARDDAERAIALGGGGPAFEAAGWAAYYLRVPEDALRYAEEGVARAADPAVKSSCLALAGRARHAIGDLGLADRLLGEALDLAPAEVRGVASVWLSGLRVHQGRVTEAEDLAARATLDLDAIPHPFAPLHGLFTLSYSLGLQGRPAEALLVVDRLDERVRVESTSGQPHRFEAVARNLRSWIIRNLGELDRAAAHSAESASLPADEPAYAEPRYAGALDVVEGHMLRGDLDHAAAALADVADVEQFTGSMAWHQRQRYWLQHARLLLAGSPGATSDEAASLAARVADDARSRGSRRYELLAGLALARATASANHDAINAALRELDAAAGLEAWWITAELAEWFDVDRWHHDAVTRANRVAARAGEHGATLLPFAMSRFPRAF